MKLQFPPHTDAWVAIELNADDIDRLLAGNTLDNADVRITLDEQAQASFVDIRHADYCEEELQDAYAMRDAYSEALDDSDDTIDALRKELADCKADLHGHHAMTDDGGAVFNTQMRGNERHAPGLGLMDGEL